MKSTSRWIVLILVLPLWTRESLAVDPAVPVDQGVVQTWSADHGLPAGTVYGLAQTADGYIWAATQEGIARFDGSEFVVYDRRSSKDIRSGFARSLLAGRDGSLYGATNKGLIHITGRLVQTYGLAQGLPTDNVNTVYQSGDRTVWIGTANGLARRQLDGTIGTVVRGSQLPNPQVTALTEDWSGQIWIGTLQGLATLKDGKLSRHDQDGFPKEQIYSLTATRDGSVWIGTKGRGLVRYRAGKFRTYGPADGLPSAIIKAVHEDAHGTIWVGSLDQGFGRFQDDRFDFTSDSIGLGKKAITSFLEDREGNLWIGSTAGLTRIADAKVRTFTTAHGLWSDRISTVLTDRHGTLWVGSGGGLQKLDGTGHTEKSGLSSNKVLSAWSGRDGSLWIGTFDGGLNHVREGRTTVYGTREGLKNLTILSVYEDRAGTIWVGTATGLQRIIGGQVAPETLLSGQAVSVLFEDRTGSVWAGTQAGGVNRISNGAVSTFNTVNGFASDFAAAIHQDATGAIWVGTVGGGLNRFKNGKWTAITSREGLFDDSVFSILEDDNGYFWMSSARGIFRVARQQLDDFAEGLQKSVSGVSYGKADGMRNRECYGGTTPAAWRTPDGTLWFATVEGLAMIQPDRARAAAAPPLLINDIYADKTRLDSNGPITVKPGTKRLEFRYSALHFAAPGKLHYQYKLEGFDQDWVDAGTRRHALYTNLRPGKYQFRVRAAVDDGPWSTASSSVRQRAFFYQAPWFLTVTVLAIVALVLIAHRSRVRIVRASAERFKLLFDRNPAASVRATNTGGVLDCNEACAKLFGFDSRASLMTHGLADLKWTDTDWTSMMSRLRDQGSLANFETGVRRPDGAQAWVLLNASLVNDSQGRPLVEATLVDITERKRAEEEIRYKAHHDVLTGLPNRALFKDRLAVALNYAHRQGNQLAVLCLDLDGFNVVNDAFGRNGGDELLKTIAERLRGCSREEDSVARVGDDEFSLLVMKPANVSDVTAVARKILQTVAAPITVGDHEFNITTSIGIAFYPQDGGDAEALLKNADSALYRAKEAGRNSYQLCSPFLARKAADRLSLETALHQALEQEEFVLHYQPQLDLRTQTVTGMEALIRWDRRGKTMLRPAEFISVAEDTRLILPIGEWAIEAACRQGALWHSQGTGVRMAVNVSPRQFQQPNIVSIIYDALDRSGFDPNYLEIEITESTAMANPDLTADILLDLKSLGISVAIDDFGVGHSSLNYLKRFPIDALKIDQSFVQDITRGGSDGAIVSAVIAMSKALNIRVIAEGVETEEQLKFLRDHGCHEVQGYLFCRPMAADALTEMIDSASPGAYTRHYARTVRAAAPPLEN